MEKNFKDQCWETLSFLHTLLDLYQSAVDNEREAKSVKEHDHWHLVCEGLEEAIQECGEVVMANRQRMESSRL